MFRGLNHVAIFVRNRREAVKFYTEVLGGELLFTVDNESDGLLIAMVQMEGFCIELLEPPAGKEEVQAAALGTQNHFAICVDDIEEALAYLKEKGFAIEEPGIYDVPDFGRAGNNMRVAFFHGPNGERIELFKAV
jgi:catechol 2,3-dioxygenase-like lactoylglutathione lyase family enzyme